MRHFLMPILTPNFKDWSKLMGPLFAICTTSYNIKFRFRRQDTMNILVDMREYSILTLPHFLPQRVKWVNFYGVVS